MRMIALSVLKLQHVSSIIRVSAGVLVSSMLAYPVEEMCLYGSAYGVR